MIQALEHVMSLALRHDGDCRLRGVTPDLALYVEEVYGDEDWLAQHVLRLDGTLMASVDEDFGNNPRFAAIPLPENILQPQPVHRTLHLNFGGARHRGLREPERIADLVSPLSVHDRMLLAERLHLDCALPQILGLAESCILAEAQLRTPDTYLVCRRFRLAYALVEPERGPDNALYDYDTLIFYAAHLYDCSGDSDVNLQDILAGIPPVELHRPMDCLAAHGHLFVADGGAADRVCKIHVWRI